MGKNLPQLSAVDANYFLVPLGAHTNKFSSSQALIPPAKFDTREVPQGPRFFPPIRHCFYRDIGIYQNTLRMCRNVAYSRSVPLSNKLWDIYTSVAVSCYVAPHEGR